MLDDEQIRSLISDMRRLHQAESAWLDRIYDYVTGRRGAPEPPEGSEQEVKDIARLSVLNVLSLVRDAFVQNLSVVGFRNALAKENNPAWKQWQANRMDARQAEVYRPAVTYGAAYVVVTHGGDGTLWRTRSPRQLLAVYEDPQVDLWPQFAFETWIDQSHAKPRRKAMLYDDTHMYPLDLGMVPTAEADRNRTDQASAAQVAEVDEPIPHGANVCPVVRFINGRDADDMIVGEIAPLIRSQQAINSVCFDRNLVSRFGAHPQKVITGWSGAESEVLKASAKRVWAFEDETVDVKTFAPADLGQYNSTIESMIEQVAMQAQISPAQVTGKMINVSAEALAAAEKAQQRKLDVKRDSFGESWEQVFRLAAEITGDSTTSTDESAEVIWRDTEARSFGAVVDGIVKLAQAGAPVEELIDLVPGVTQQKVQAVRDGIRRNQVNGLMAALRPPASPQGDVTGNAQPQ